MNAVSTTSPAFRATSGRAPARPAAARAVLAAADAIVGGRICWHLPDGSVHLSGDGGRELAVTVRDWAAFARTLGRGDIGFAEAWLARDLDGDALPELLTLLARNRDRLADVLHGRWWQVLPYRLRHLLRANTRAGSRRNIMAHYDLGNEFYAAWLDDSMTYSSALFDDGGASLERGQQRKYQRILDTLQVQPGAEILEIGCGWGGFAAAAVTRAGARVHGITVSPAQRDHACARLAVAGLAGRANLELRDYRDLGQLGRRFDHVVSIEMFEAVGERQWATYFASLRALLTDRGRAIVQSIVIEPSRFDAYRRQTDFIQQYIFPGGMLPSVPAFTAAAARHGLQVSEVFDFGADYARTLALWRARFDNAWPAIAQQGFDEKFRRLWHFYLAYCEAGFAAGATSVVQFTLARAP